MWANAIYMGHGLCSTSVYADDAGRVHLYWSWHDVTEKLRISRNLISNALIPAWYVEEA